MNKDLGFVADKLIAQEVAVSLLLNALQELYPEVIAKIINNLDHVLKTSPMPTPGARANLVALRNGIATNQPSPQAGN
jgi:hypothetical protein